MGDVFVLVDPARWFSFAPTPQKNKNHPYPSVCLLPLCFFFVRAVGSTCSLIFSVDLVSARPNPRSQSRLDETCARFGPWPKTSTSGPAERHKDKAQDLLLSTARGMDGPCDCIAQWLNDKTVQLAFGIPAEETCKLQVLVASQIPSCDYQLTGLTKLATAEIDEARSRSACLSNRTSKKGS